MDLGVYFFPGMSFPGLSTETCLGIYRNVEVWKAEFDKVNQDVIFVPHPYPGQVHLTQFQRFILRISHLELLRKHELFINVTYCSEKCRFSCPSTTPIFLDVLFSGEIKRTLFGIPICTKYLQITKKINPI